jgi:dTDP-4-amino-4,6-dideoxygalactose transaminase
MVSSGQAALEVALILAKVRLGKNKLKVLIPSTTYAATLWAILNTNNEPIFADIDTNYVLDLHKAIEDGTADQADVLMPVDLCGYSAYSAYKNDYDMIRLKGKFIIQDACEAFWNKYACYGDIICHSFYVSHIITTGSGGMLSLDDKELAQYARSYISHGRVFGGDFTKFKDKWVDRFLFDKVGASCRSDNLSASLGLSQMEDLDTILSRRNRNANILSSHGSAILDEYFHFVDIHYIRESVFQFYPILIKKKINREELLQYLFEHDIDSRVLLSLTNQPIMQQLYGDIEPIYPVSANVNKNGFLVGCHQDLVEDDMRYILTTLTAYCAKIT